MAIIYHQILIKASRAKIYEVLTAQDGMSLWLGPDCAVKPQVGFINEFGIGNQARYRMKVIHLQPGYSVEWKCVNQHDDWTGTQLSFHLSDKGESTCLDFKQSGFATESEAYATTNYQWAILLTLLKQLCERVEIARNGSVLNIPLVALNAGKV